VRPGSKSGNGKASDQAWPTTLPSEFAKLILAGGNLDRRRKGLTSKDLRWFQARLCHFATGMRPTARPSSTLTRNHATLNQAVGAHVEMAGGGCQPAAARQRQPARADLTAVPQTGRTLRWGCSPQTTKAPGCRLLVDDPANGTGRSGAVSIGWERALALPAPGRPQHHLVRHDRVCARRGKGRAIPGG
jgi:hypothetical protein